MADIFVDISLIRISTELSILLVYKSAFREFSKCEKLTKRLQCIVYCVKQHALALLQDPQRMQHCFVKIYNFYDTLLTIRQSKSFLSCFTAIFNSLVGIYIDSWLRNNSLISSPTLMCTSWSWSSSWPSPSCFAWLPWSASKSADH